MPNYSGVWTLQEQYEAILSGNWTGIEQYELWAWGYNNDGHGRRHNRFTFQLCSSRFCD